MPTLQKQYTLTVTPEQFLSACSVSELHELQLLLNSARYQNKMYGANQESEVPEMPVIKPSFPERP